MDFQKITSALENLIPTALLLGLVADWIRLRAKHRAEEKKLIGLVICELLQLRHTVVGLRELPKALPKLMPPELRNQIPDEAWPIMIAQALPILISKMSLLDENFAERYSKAVDEIAGHRPLLAFELRGKERYFDLRSFLSAHFSTEPGNLVVASKLAEQMDREYLPVLEETIRLLAKSHGPFLRFQIRNTLRRRRLESTPAFKRITKVFQEQVREIAKSQSSLPPTEPPSGQPPA